MRDELPGHFAHWLTLFSVIVHSSTKLGIPAVVPLETESKLVDDGQAYRHVCDQRRLTHFLLRHVLEPAVVEQVVAFDACYKSTNHHLFWSPHCSLHCNYKVSVKSMNIKTCNVIESTIRVQSTASISSIEICKILNDATSVKFQ